MTNTCNICPNNCGVNREQNVYGKCGVLNDVIIAKYYLHPFEEPVLSRLNGSGTVFFSGCGLRCVFCQNYELSRAKRGKTVTVSELADIFKELEDMGANNINLVTPSHYVYQIIKALNIYRPKIPIVYNTHSYEKLTTLKDIDPYIDVYLPDLKFCDQKTSLRYTGIKDYFEIATQTINFMMNSKKTIIENDLIKSGVIVRHLILPLQIENSLKIVEWFANNQKSGAYFSLMSQYTPMGDIDGFPELKRKITKREYNKVLDYVFQNQIQNCFIQDLESADKSFIPEWDF